MLVMNAMTTTSGFKRPRKADWFVYIEHVTSFHDKLLYTRQ